MELWIMVAVYFVKVCVQQVPPPDANVDNNAGLRWPVFSWVILSKNLVDFIMLLTLDKGVTPCSRGKTGQSSRVRVRSIGFASQTGHGSKRVILNGSIRLRVNQVLSRVGSGQVYPYFSKFFFFNYKNKSMTTCLERMNKIS